MCVCVCMCVCVSIVTGAQPASVNPVALRSHPSVDIHRECRVHGHTGYTWTAAVGVLVCGAAGHMHQHDGCRTGHEGLGE